MSRVTWLHLSDWHHRDMSLDRQVMRDKLLRDIERRAVINEKLANIDFILFSGDISFSGAKEEFDAVRSELIAPIRAILGRKTPVYCVPGNHDVERGRIAEISPDLLSTIARIADRRAWQDFNDIAGKPATARQLNIPLSNYFEFIKAVKRGASNRSKLYSVERIKVKGGFTVGVICINTAWNSARFEIQHTHKSTVNGSNPWVWDYGLLRITETQLQNAISELGKVNLTILMMHHPLHWIDEFERAKLEQTLFDNCHIVIHGHEHRPNTSRISSAFGDLVFIPAGATYVGRSPEDPRYTNAFNFCVVDTKQFSGTVYHRIWLEERGLWQADERFWSQGQSQFLLARTKDYDLKLAHRSIINSNKQYIKYIDKRGALEHEVTIRHDAETVDGEAFIRQHVKIRIKLRAGPPEQVFWNTGVDEMIVNHPNEKVRRRAYRLVGFSPKMQKVKYDKQKRHLFSWQGMADANEQWIEYEYEKLDLPNNFYFMNISRFTDRVKFSIKPADGYKYFRLPIGGFPPLGLTRNKLLSVDTLETEEMILPSQGYIIQWCPEHKSAAVLGQGGTARNGRVAAAPAGKRGHKLGKRPAASRAHAAQA